MLLLLLAACGGPPCPAGTHQDPERAARISALAHATGLEICFGMGVEAGHLPGDRVQLDPGWTDPSLAARLAHLAIHGIPPQGPDCTEAALQEEAHALEVELELRAGLGALSDPGSPQVALLWTAAPPEARPALVRSWLVAHPANVTALTRRCRQASGTAQSVAGSAIDLESTP